MPPRKSRATEDAAASEAEVSGAEAASVPTLDDEPNRDDAAIPFTDDSGDESESSGDESARTTAEDLTSNTVAAPDSTEGENIAAPASDEDGGDSDNPFSDLGVFASGVPVSSVNVDPRTGVPDINDGSYVDSAPDPRDPTQGPGAIYFGNRQQLRHSGMSSEEVNEKEREARRSPEGRRELYG